ncbi:unnamed protein product [Soboliphyme baturini]|uniref:SAM-dependent MTase TRM10-type domain-containing protein n=1 Tax=Soboliphyme baturini TaxID=241478 RepID=A0A183IS33_9BILA|nr:unnamed protein product [Soboliphyme baturini]
MCGISDIFDRDELFAEDGPLSECHKWMSTVEGVITKLSQGTAEQNDCLQQRFLQMLGGMLNSCYQQKTGSSWTLPDYDRNFNSYRTEESLQNADMDEGVRQLLITLRPCPADRVRIRKPWEGGAKFVYSSNGIECLMIRCRPVSKCVFKHALPFNVYIVPDYRPTAFTSFVDNAVPIMALDRSMSDKLTLAKKAVFSDVAKRDCVDAVDAATGGLLLNLEAALMTCLNLEQKKAISRLADIGCGKKTIFNEGYKSKLDFAMTFVMAAVHVYKDRVMRFCLAECPVD